MKSPSSRAGEAAAYVEEWGLLFEGSGLPRMAGRILGSLLICEPEHQSAAELVESLSASKGSISTVTRLLERFELIERVSLPGDRVTRFRVKPEAFTALMGQKLQAVSVWKNLARRGLELTGRGNARLKEIDEFYGFLEREFPPLLARWKKVRRR